MKNYFDFYLTGKKLLPIWIVFLLAFLAPYIAIVVMMKDILPGETPPMFIFPLIFLLLVIAFVITFYMVKLAVVNVAYQEKNLAFRGSFGRFIGVVLLGSFLSIITLGVYLAWFIRNLHRFFVDNTSYGSNGLRFQGKGAKLFVIILLTLMLPMVGLSVIMMQFFLDCSQDLMFSIASQMVTMIIMIPYLYYFYKWMIDIKYKEYSISWKTKFWAAFGKIAIEFLIMMLTVGIYMPLAYLRLYKYFAERTVAESSDNQLTFGYDIDQLGDFLFIWGQLLLTIVTVGIYYPWAFCKIGKRILSKTYLEKR